MPILWPIELKNSMFHLPKAVFIKLKMLIKNVPTIE